MTISIQCGQCAKQYKVDEKLAGKKVKCRDCGAAITVGRGMAADRAGRQAESSDPTDREPDIFGLTEEEPANDLASVAAGAAHRPAAHAMRLCPACKTSVAKESVICLSCGYNFRTGRGGKSTIPLSDDVPEAPVVKKRRNRQRGSDLLHSIDGYLGMAVFLISAAGILAWMVHVIKTAPHFSIGLILPTAVVLGLIVGVVAPLTTTAIKIAAHLLNFPARHDTYTRVLMVFMLPFAMALLCGGSVAQNPALADTLSSSWLAACGLFVFLFRDETVELAATCGAALAATLISWAAVQFVAMLLTLATGPLYIEAMPPAGPWVSLAAGHSPVGPTTTPAPANQAVAQGTVPPPTASTSQEAPQPGALFTGTKDPTPAPGAVAPATVSPTAVAPAENTNATGTTVNSHEPSTPPPAPIQTPRALPPERVASLSNPPGIPGTTPPAVPDVGAKTELHSPFLKDIQQDPALLAGVREICTPLTPSSWMLAIKNLDAGTVAVQRWSTDPLTKHGELKYQELPQQPNSYALSPNGTYLVVLSHFPRWQLEIATFDDQPARRIPLTDKLPEAEAAAIPGLLGFTDATHFLIRWDLNGRTLIQVCNCPNGQGFRKIMTESFDTSVNDWAISPDGRLLAILNNMPGAARELWIYDVHGNGTTIHFNPVTMNFICKGMAFSPDSKMIALYTVAREATSVLGFSLPKGEPVDTAILPQSTEPFLPMRMTVREGQTWQPRGLCWLKDSNEWLVNATAIYDPGTGRKVGDIGLPGINNQHALNPDVVVLTQRAATPTHDMQKLVIAKLDEGGIRDGVAKLRK